APLAPLARRILAAIDALADLSRLGPRRSDRPVRPGADAETALCPVDPVGKQEGARPLRVHLARRKQSDGETGDLAVVDQQRVSFRWFEGLDQALGQLLSHGFFESVLELL